MRFSLISVKERGQRATVSGGRERLKKETAGGRRKKENEAGLGF
jgi:hypothetical protein